MWLLLALYVCRIKRAAVDRTDLLALRLVEVAHAFGAATGVYDVDFIACGDRIIGTFRLADVTVNAFVGNYEGHETSLISRRPPA